MNRSDTIASLAAALVAAQAEIENASKNAKNDHFRNRYADLAEVLNTVRPVFAKNGIAIIQSPTLDGNVVSVETMLMHSSGEWISDSCSTPVSKNDAQGIGSAITYMRRYSLAAFAGVAQEDDDGNGATGAGQKQAPKPRQQPAPQQPTGKKPMTPELWPQVLAAIEAGKRTPEYIRNTYELTDEQDNELHAILNQE